MPLFDSTVLAAAATRPVPVPVAPVPTATALVRGLGDAAWVEASRALTAPNVVIPDMARPFLPWQAAAYSYCVDAIARWGGALLGDDMGLGKTQVMQALIARAIRPGGYAIVIAPPVASAGWRSDLAAAFPHLRMAVVKGHTRKAIPHADIYFVSDDSRTMKVWLTDVTGQNNKGKDILGASKFAQGARIITRDEIHRDKGNQGKPSGRSLTMLALGEHCRTVGKPIVAATGTLLTNRPVEGFMPLQIVGGPDLVKAVSERTTMSGYLWRFCAPTKGYGNGREYTTYGVSEGEMLALHDNLRASLYMRREKSDLGEGILPHAGWSVVPVELPDSSLRRYTRLVNEILTVLTEEAGIEAARRAAKALGLRQIMMLWEEAGRAKAEATIDYVKVLADGGDQVVVFYHHQEVFTKLAEACTRNNLTWVAINGQVTDDEDRGKFDRTNAIADFQAGDAQVCLAQIKSAGMAVTLTAARHAVFAQCPWSAGDLKQAADRIYRTDAISQARAQAGEKVQWHVLQGQYADGEPTFDAVIFNVLERKAHVCDSVNAGRPITLPEESVMIEALMAWHPRRR